MRLDNTSNSAIGGSDSTPSTRFTDQGLYPTTPHLNDGTDSSPTMVEPNPEIDKPVDSEASIVQERIIEPVETTPIEKQRTSHFGIVFGLLLSVALLGGGGYFYWRTYEASLNNRLTAEKLYQKGCQPSEWANASAIASANESFGRAQAILQKVPNFPGLGYEDAQSGLAKVAQCNQQLQSASNTINYQLGLTQQVQNLVSDVGRFSEQFSPHLGYQAYSAELQRLQNNLQTFEQSNDFVYIQNQESLEPLKRSLAALRGAHDDLAFAYRVWSYCQAENACFRSTGTSEEFLPTSSDPIPEVAAVLINSYRMTSEQPMGWFILPRNGIALNKALNTVWLFSEQDLQEAQRAINEEVAYLQGNPQ